MADPLLWEDSRFQRFSLISWWAQERLRKARVLVIGAGALGNEIVKNLALLGVGNLVVVDMDKVELSNLSRSALFREADKGRPKAEVVCDAARSIYPQINARPLSANVLHGVGLGLFSWADVVLGGLDSREARLAVSRACSLVKRPWVDGAIDVLGGIVRVFQPGEGACYECTLSEADWAMLDQRRACTLLPRDGLAEPRVPTTPTTASVIAGMQCAEAVKLLHSMEGLKGEGFIFDGRGFDCYKVAYQRAPDCYGHEALDEIIALEGLGADSAIGDLLKAIRARSGQATRIEVCRELVSALECRDCGITQPWRGALDALTAGDAACVKCAKPCTPAVYHRLDVPFLDGGLHLRDLGIPPRDIIRCHEGDRTLGFELAADLVV